MKMAKIELPKLYRVTVTEYERGYGQRRLSEDYYDSEEDAKKACHEVNRHNTSTDAPDCYIKASYTKLS